MEKERIVKKVNLEQSSDKLQVQRVINGEWKHTFEELLNVKVDKISTLREYLDTLSKTISNQNNEIKHLYKEIESIKQVNSEQADILIKLAENQKLIIEWVNKQGGLF